MDEQNFDWKPVRVKSESELILNENDKTDGDSIGTSPPVLSDNFSKQSLVALEEMVFNFADDVPSATKFTSSTSNNMLEGTHKIKDENTEDEAPWADSNEEAKCQIPSSKFQEQTQNVSKSIPNFFPAATPPTPSTSQDALEGTLKIKEETIEDEDPFADPFLRAGQQDPSEMVTSVYHGDGSVPSPERIYIKMENDFEERNVAEKEHQEIEFIDMQEVRVKNEFYHTLDFPVYSVTEKNQSLEISSGGSEFTVPVVNKIEEDSAVVDSRTSPESKSNQSIKILASTSGSADERSFSCSECFARFKIKASLSRHLLTHSDERAFSCKQCSARFKRKIDLDHHSVIHSDERAFSCSQCSARFKRKKDLKTHSLTHSCERAFVCDLCPARFKRKRELTVHCSSHSDRRNFCCEQCSAQFKRKTHLQNHLLTHSNEKAFSCDTCSAQFKTKASLGRHLLTHSDERAFSCNLCSARFKRKTDLDHHSVTHSDERAFSCRQCSVRFKRKKDLKKHSLQSRCLRVQWLRGRL